MPDRRVEDNYYKKNQFVVRFDVSPLTKKGEDNVELDEEARTRALYRLLVNLKEQTDLKVSAFIDVFPKPKEDTEEPEEKDKDWEDNPYRKKVEEGIDRYRSEGEADLAEFIVYNKMGITSLNKLRRFMEEAMRGGRVVLSDPKTGKQFAASNFTIRYLFHDFVAGRPPNDWSKLKELATSEDRGYAVLMTSLDKKEKSGAVAEDEPMRWTAEEAREIGAGIGIDWDEVKFQPDDLMKGMEVELEHGTKLGDSVNITDDDPDMTAQIAWAHLMEDPDYYDLLAEMEKSFGGEEDRDRDGYMRVVDPSSTHGRSTISSDLQKKIDDYLSKVVEATDNGMSVNDAFKKVRPNLDKMTSDQLLSMLWENQKVGKIPVNSLKLVVKYGGDIYDAIQRAFENFIFQQAAIWWGEQKTQEKTQPASPKAKQKETTETTETKASVVYAGYRYKELD